MTTLQPLTPSLFGDELAFSVEVSHAKTSQPPTDSGKVLTGNDQDSTEKSLESPESADHLGFFLRTCISLCIEDLIGYLPTWTQKATPQGRSYYQAGQPEAPINENVSGWLHTPTRVANQLAPSMMKHECCRNFQRTYGDTLEPWMFEEMMGFPIGWTSLEDQDCKH